MKNHKVIELSKERIKIMRQIEELKSRAFDLSHEMNENVFEYLNERGLIGGQEFILSFRASGNKYYVQIVKLISKKDKEPLILDGMTHLLEHFQIWDDVLGTNKIFISYDELVIAFGSMKELVDFVNEQNITLVYDEVFDREFRATSKKLGIMGGVISLLKEVKKLDKRI